MGEGAVFSDPWSEDACLSHLKSDYTYTLVAFLGDRLVGYLLASALPPESELYRIAVLPDVQGCGIGDRLLMRYLCDMEARGVASFFLEVREHNTKAQRLYLKNGYKRVGVRRRYYKGPTEDALLFARDTQA